MIGDIHGSFDLVISAMKKVSFNKEKDRLIAVGDLIDRGTGSHRCAQFLSQPYVFSVLGNHEDMLLEIYQNGDVEEAALHFLCRRNGLDWWLDTDKRTRRNILKAIAELPIALEIETERGLVGFVHADVPENLSWSEFKKKLEDGDSHVRETALWGRSRLHGNNVDGVEGVGRLFVGHTPQWGGVKRLGNVYAVDTGAVFRDLGIKEEGALSAVNILATTKSLSEKRESIELVQIFDEIPQDKRPFGNYAKRN